jgi:hypothetical protein
MLEQVKKLNKCYKCKNIIIYKFINSNTIKPKCLCNKICHYCNQIKKTKYMVHNNAYLQFKLCKCNSVVTLTFCPKCNIQYKIYHNKNTINILCKCNNDIHEIYDNNTHMFTIN